MSAGRVGLAVAVVPGEPVDQAAWERAVADDPTLVVRFVEGESAADATRRGVLELLDEGLPYVGFWGADVEAPLSFVDRLVESLESGKAAAFASRLRVIQRPRQDTWVRHYLGRGLASAISWALTVPVYDSQCRAKLFVNDERTRRIFAEPLEPTPTFEVELLARLVREQGPDFDVTRDCEEVLLPAWSPSPRPRIRPADYPAVVGQLVRIRRQLRG